MDSEGEFLIWTALAIFIPLTLSVMIQGVYRTWVEYFSAAICRRHAIRCSA